MRHKVIVNPLAGRGAGARCLPRLRRLLSAYELDFELVITTRAGEAIELAREAMLDGCETVVAVGGDGTYHEVINGMLSGSNAHVVGDLGVVPVGSGCDFAWAMGIPSDLEGACKRVAQHRTKVIDLGRASVEADPHGGDPGSGRPDNGQRTMHRYFDNSLGIGFDGVVTVESRKVRHLRGMALYLPVVLKTVFLSLKPPRSVIEYETDGTLYRLEKKVLMATVCNGPREGGGFHIAPQAKNDDGILDLCLADDMPRLQILGMIPHFMQGTHVDKPAVTMARAKRFAITSPDPLIAHVDGEILCTDAHRIECEIVPQRLKVIY